MPLPSDSKTVRLVRFLEVTVLVVATLYFGRTILLPIVAAALVTFLLAPIRAAQFQQETHLSKAMFRLRPTLSCF